MIPLSHSQFRQGFLEARLAQALSGGKGNGTARASWFMHVAFWSLA
jgi:hypothetical protein